MVSGWMKDFIFAWTSSSLVVTFLRCSAETPLYLIRTIKIKMPYEFKKRKLLGDIVEDRVVGNDVGVVNDGLSLVEEAHLRQLEPNFRATLIIKLKDDKSKCICEKEPFRSRGRGICGI